MATKRTIDNSIDISTVANIIDTKWRHSYTQKAIDLEKKKTLFVLLNTLWSIYWLARRWAFVDLTIRGGESYLIKNAWFLWANVQEGLWLLFEEKRYKLYMRMDFSENKIPIYKKKRGLCSFLYSLLTSGHSDGFLNPCRFSFVFRFMRGTWHFPYY